MTMSLPSGATIPSHLQDTARKIGIETPLQDKHLPSMSLAAKYRGAVIADLDLPPALSVPSSIPIVEALTLSYDRSYDQLTVIDSSDRSLKGYLSIPKLKSLLSQGTVTEDDSVEKAMTRFRRAKGVEYQVITPDTGLDELEEFLVNGSGKESGFAVVTDTRRKWVMAIATRDDLENFVKRRP